ncbi:hypothetical protein KEM56_004787, partial [Ascosphaera pollenicola]
VVRMIWISTSLNLPWAVTRMGMRIWRMLAATRMSSSTMRVISPERKRRVAKNRHLRKKKMTRRHLVSMPRTTKPSWIAMPTCRLISRLAWRGRWLTKLRRMMRRQIAGRRDGSSIICQHSHRSTTMRSCWRTKRKAC